MKRKFEDLTSEECLIVFDKLPIEKKRQLLSSTTAEKDISVYTHSNLFKDIIGIIIKNIDLQSWGRLRQTCHMFNKSLKMHPRLTPVYELYERNNIAETELKSNSHFLTCTSFYVAHVKRFILYAHNLMNSYIEAFLANPPAPEIITRMDGSRVEVFKKTPKNFDLDTSLKELQHFSLDHIGYKKRKWHTIVFNGAGSSSCVRISYPYGFICGPDGKNPHGNIFTDDWKDLLHINYYDHVETKAYKHMSKGQRKRFKIQKEQLAFTKKLV
jgi:hypothetical protein